MNILLVDDDPNVLNALSRELKEVGSKIYLANSGLQGLDIIKGEENIGLIISDYSMPGMKGSEFLHEARRYNMRSFNVILSAHHDFYNIVKGLNTGEINRFISKPWDKEIIVNLVKAATKYKSDQHYRDSNPSYVNSGYFESAVSFQSFLENFDNIISQSEVNICIGVLVISLYNQRKILSMHSVEQYCAINRKIYESLKEILYNQYYFTSVSNTTYAVLIPYQDISFDLIGYTQNLLLNLEKRCVLKECNIEPEFVGGIAIYPKNGVAVDVLLRNALISMYSANVYENNIVHFEQTRKKIYGENNSA